jgi:hypothetical protein
MRHTLPADFTLSSVGARLSLTATVATQHDINAIIWALEMLKKSYPSHRVAVPGDLGLPEARLPTDRDLMIAAGIMPTPTPTPGE